MSSIFQSTLSIFIFFKESNADFPSCDAYGSGSSSALEIASTQRKEAVNSKGLIDSYHSTASFRKHAADDLLKSPNTSPIAANQTNDQQSPTNASYQFPGSFGYFTSTPQEQGDFNQASAAGYGFPDSLLNYESSSAVRGSHPYSLLARQNHSSSNSYRNFHHESGWNDSDYFSQRTSNDFNFGVYNGGYADSVNPNHHHHHHHSHHYHPQFDNSFTHPPPWAMNGVHTPYDMELSRKSAGFRGFENSIRGGGGSVGGVNSGLLYARRRTRAGLRSSGCPESIETGEQGGGESGSIGSECKGYPVSSNMAQQRQPTSQHQQPLHVNVANNEASKYATMNPSTNSQSLTNSHWRPQG